MSFKEKKFAINGVVEFGPFYPPDRISIEKERELNRKQNMCDGEDVTDEGSKNRDIHVAGVLRESEIPAFHDLLDNDEEVELYVDAWSGFVHTRRGEVEGPTDWDPHHEEWLFSYNLDFVATGQEEKNGGNHGIIDDGGH